MYPDVRSVAVNQTSPYATGHDFCRIFAEDMKGLYTLALLLTADGQNAERCFLSAMEESLRTTRVFKDWARSWTRRAVMQHAVSMQQPARQHRIVSGATPSNQDSKRQGGFSMPAVLGLPTFERFAFVMSVLERCADQECAVLLGCSRSEVANARARALDALMSSHEGQVPGTQFFGSDTARAEKTA